MYSHSNKRNWFTDLTGGSTATILALPEAMAYGTIVFSPLGPEYLPLGVLTGIIALCFSNIGAAKFGGVPIMNNGPYSLTSLMLASALTNIAQKVPDGNIDSILFFLFLIVSLVGLFQILFGLFKIGEMVKYIPYPVVSGLLNGTAILIFLGQIRPMFGLSTESLLWDIDEIQIPTLMVGLVTIFIVSIGPKISKKIPSPFIGIAAGTITYYSLTLIGAGTQLGSTVGTIPFLIPKPAYATAYWNLVLVDNFFEIFKSLIPLSFSIAVVASLQSLIASVSADKILKKRSNTNKELLGQGIGNLVSSVFGGIVSAGSQSRAMACYSYGGRTSNSQLLGGIFGLTVLLFIGPVISKLPQVVLSGMLVVLAFRSFDSWGINLLALFFSKKAKFKQIWSDLILVAAVTAILVIFGVFEAVFLGLFISIIFFIFRMGKDVIRREYSASRIRSNVHRSLEEIEYLEANGHKIRVYELEGSLFFGTADRIAYAVEKVLETDIEVIIVDLRRLSDVDSTGANILLRIGDNCKEKNKHFILSSSNMVKNGDSLSTALSVSKRMNGDNHRTREFENIDAALGWAEDRLLSSHFSQDRYKVRLSLSNLDVLYGFSDKELSVFKNYLSEINCRSGEVIFSQFTPSDSMYFLVQGIVGIVVHLPQNNGRKKIATLCPGTIFGEMAMIDGGVRSASVAVESRAVCYKLTKSDLFRLNKEQPEISRKLLIGISRELSKRVRISNRIATELKEFI